MNETAQVRRTISFFSSLININLNCIRFNNDADFFLNSIDILLSDSNMRGNKVLTRARHEKIRNVGKAVKQLLNQVTMRD